MVIGDIPGLREDSGKELDLGLEGVNGHAEDNPRRGLSKGELYFDLFSSVQYLYNVFSHVQRGCTSCFCITLDLICLYKLSRNNCFSLSLHIMGWPHRTSHAWAPSVFDSFSHQLIVSTAEGVALAHASPTWSGKVASPTVQAACCALSADIGDRTAHAAGGAFGRGRVVRWYRQPVAQVGLDLGFSWLCRLARSRRGFGFLRQCLSLALRHLLMRNPRRWALLARRSNRRLGSGGHLCRSSGG
jgi:hypothetical protein